MTKPEHLSYAEWAYTCDMVKADIWQEPIDSIDADRAMRWLYDNHVTCYIAVMCYMAGLTQRQAGSMMGLGITRMRYWRNRGIHAVRWWYMQDKEDDYAGY